MTCFGATRLHLADAIAAHFEAGGVAAAAAGAALAAMEGGARAEDVPPVFAPFVSHAIGDVPLDDAAMAKGQASAARAAAMIADGNGGVKVMRKGGDQVRPKSSGGRGGGRMAGGGGRVQRPTTVEGGGGGSQKRSVRPSGKAISGGFSGGSEAPDAASGGGTANCNINTIFFIVFFYRKCRKNGELPLKNDDFVMKYRPIILQFEVGGGAEGAGAAGRRVRGERASRCQAAHLRRLARVGGVVEVVEAVGVVFAEPAVAGGAVVVGGGSRRRRHGWSRPNRKLNEPSWHIVNCLTETAGACCTVNLGMVLISSAARLVGVKPEQLAYPPLGGT